jgi:hypothetical protein
MDKIFSLATRGLSALAVLIVAIAVAEETAELLLGRSLIGGEWTPGRLLEFAAIVMTFVVALLLRDIRALLSAPAARTRRDSDAT